MKTIFSSLFLALMSFAVIADPTNAPSIYQNAAASDGYLTNQKPTYYGVLQANSKDNISSFRACNASINESAIDCETNGEVIMVNFSEIDLTGGAINTLILASGGMIVIGGLGFPLSVGIGVMLFSNLGAASILVSMHNNDIIMSPNSEESQLAPDSSRMILFETEKERTKFLNLLLRNRSKHPEISPYSP